jgi:D-alanine-D-alanine ligase
VVKPASQGSSIGLSIVHGKEDFTRALDTAFTYDSVVLVERYIEGKELTVGIVGDEALPVIEIVPKTGWYDYAAKYTAGMTEYLVPAPLSRELASRVQRDALTAHRALGCRGFSRVDFRLDHDDTPFILEVNAIPGLTGTSLLPKAAKAHGVEFKDLCVKILTEALRHNAAVPAR